MHWACAILSSLACPPHMRYIVISGLSASHALYCHLWAVRLACPILSSLACPAHMRCIVISGLSGLHALYCHLWPVRLACAILSSLACPALHDFSTLSHKRHHCWKKLLNTKCAFWFSLQILPATFLIIRITERDIIKNVYWSSRKVTVVLVRS
jgi:hypothetical protein